MQSRLRWVAVASVVACLGGCGGDEGSVAQGDRETRALMGEIFQAIRILLPASLGDEPFSDPGKKEQVDEAMGLLTRSAERLGAHVKGDEQGRFLAGSVARDAQNLARVHAQGQNHRAAYLVRKLTENCVVCHSRLPDAEARPLAAGFVDRDGLDELPPEQRAALQMATRRFDGALQTLEEQLASSDHPAMLFGSLTDYLVVSIRTKRDFARPVPVLERFAQRQDLWTGLRRDVEAWIQVLPELEKRAAGAPRLEVAREMSTEARGLAIVPESHRSVAHYVVVSGILERFIEANPAPSKEVAEAYYLLGLSEAWIGRNYWVTSAPFLLETAIRMAPDQPFANHAYDLLERETLLTYEGADEALPPEDAAHLEELRALLDAS